MSVIYLKHERHGTKVAIDDAEAKQDEANGWVRFVHGAEVEEAEPETNVSEIEPARQKRKYTKRA